MNIENNFGINNLEILLKIIKSRRSIRNFQKTSVSQEDIKILVDAATWAPSACNKQLWSLFVLKKKPLEKNL